MGAETDKAVVFLSRVGAVDEYLDEADRLREGGRLEEADRLYLEAMQSIDQLIESGPPEGVPVELVGPSVLNLVFKVSDSLKEAEHLELALQYGENALQLNSTLGGADASVGTVNLLNHLGLILVLLQRYEEACEYWHRALETPDVSVYIQAILRFHLGQAYWRRNALDKAIHWIESAVEIAGETASAEEKAMMLNAIGQVYQQKGEGERAQAYYERALELESSRE